MSDYHFEKLNIQWYPGHMMKARRMIEEHISMVDAVCEILDARIPQASRNPDIQALSGDKPRLVILNRSDLADASITAEWKSALEREGLSVMVTDAKSGKGVGSFSSEVRKLLADKIRFYESKGQTGRALRCVILGIPNVGKSTFINKVAGRKAALAGDRPGVTRGKQWITLPNGIELLDTPGILWPRFESQEVGELLAITGAIKTEVFDTEALAANLMLRLREMYPEALRTRYKLEPAPEATGYELLETAARKRGFLVSGGEADTERMAITLLRELHEGKLGRLSLERPE
jgi:ribosome biogenesis GTPase A